VSQFAVDWIFDRRVIMIGSPVIGFEVNCASLGFLDPTSTVQINSKTIRATYAVDVVEEDGTRIEDPLPMIDPETPVLLPQYSQVY
jgi:hypothetical protein